MCVINYTISFTLTCIYFSIPYKVDNNVIKYDRLSSLVKDVNVLTTIKFHDINVASFVLILCIGPYQCIDISDFLHKIKCPQSFLSSPSKICQCQSFHMVSDHIYDYEH